MHCTHDEGAGDLARLLASGDLDSVASSLAGELPAIGVEPDVSQGILTCQLALLMGEELPEALKDRLPGLAAHRDSILAGLAQQIVSMNAGGPGQGHLAGEQAASALMWLERDHPSLASRCLLLQATAALDGCAVAERLASTFIDAEEESTALVNLLRLQFAALRRSWEEVIEHSTACLQSAGWSGRMALPIWLEALSQRRDPQASMVALSELPDKLQTPSSRALHGSLLWRSGDLEQAQELWRIAISGGWADFDATFAQALASIDLEPTQLLAVAACESRAQSEARITLASRSELPSEVVDVLLASEDSEVRASLAANPSIPVKVLQQLAQLGVYEAIEVAGNAAAPGELLAELATRPEASIRRAVASSPLCPLSVLEQLALDAELVVLTAVRDNPSSPDNLRVQVALML